MASNIITPEVELPVENETETTVATRKKRIRPDVNVDLIFDTKEEAENAPPKIQGYDSSIVRTPDGEEVIRTKNDSQTKTAEGYFLYLVNRPNGDKVYVWGRNPDSAKSTVAGKDNYAVSLADPSQKGRQWVPNEFLLTMLRAEMTVHPEKVAEFVSQKANRRYAPLLGISLPDEV